MVNMKNRMAEKVLIHLELASEETCYSDQRRVTHALRELGYDKLNYTLQTLRKLYPLCRDTETDYTVTLVHRWDENVVWNIEAGDTRDRLYGIAVDYGSTTILQQLVQLTDGKVVYECRITNRQRAYGLDILTRITHGMEGPDGKHDLQAATVATFHEGFEQIRQNTGIDPATCPVMVISGNTTMVHFLLELDAWTVFAAPYSPVTTYPGFFVGTELGLNFPGHVFIMPSASNYVGGDIVSGLLTIDLQKDEKVRVLFDVGTNGELVIGNNEWVIAGAGAAGPALEGDISKYGMVAGSGAIDHVKIVDNKLTYTTIDGEKPVGICGSGIIDLMAEMRLAGWLDIAGKLNPKASENIVQKEMENGLPEYVAVYVWASDSGCGEDLYFSQQEIEQYIETKAAAHTMVDCLLEVAGIEESDIHKMYLTGAFCNHSDLESAITIGMFPDLNRDCYVGLRNSSLDGARLLLMNRDKLEDIRRILKTVYCVQLASIPDFMIRMMASKFLPHTDMAKYPRVAQKLKERGVN